MLEGLKERLKERTEKNAAKVELSYTDKKGELITELVYLKRSTLPLGDWHRIYPAVNETNNNINWVNTLIGGKKNFIKLLIIMGIVILAFLAYHEIASQYNILANSPCALDCFTKFK